MNNVAFFDIFCLILGINNAFILINNAFFSLTVLVVFHIFKIKNYKLAKNGP